jgi:hypothetical protein
MGERTYMASARDSLVLAPVADEEGGDDAAAAAFL